MENRVTTAWKRRSDQTSERDRPVGRAARPERILIVDNDMGSADSVELMLHAAGFPETRVAYSGTAALVIALDFRPSVVLVDLSLLDMTGYELAQSLRERAQGEQRLIALTSSPEHVAREQARIAGFERYLLKPVTSTGLTRLLERSSQ